MRLLANQTAVAILNAEQAERLRALYEANIDRSEHERRELANSIHDEILRNLAILNNSVPDEALPTTTKTPMPTSTTACVVSPADCAL
ncbi:MAG: hypothetical protein R2856_14050 [Caldilineaceae bacterium]